MPASVLTNLAVVIDYDDTRNGCAVFPVGNTANKIRRGDPVRWDSSNNRIDLADVESYFATFCGIAAEEYNPDQVASKVPTEILIYQICTIRAPLTGVSAAQAPGSPFKLSTAGNYTPDSGSNATVAWFRPYPGTGRIAANATTAELTINVHLLQEQFGAISAQ